MHLPSLQTKSIVLNYVSLNLSVRGDSGLGLPIKNGHSLML